MLKPKTQKCKLCGRRRTLNYLIQLWGGAFKCREVSACKYYQNKEK